MAEHVVPHFHNDVGAAVVEIGAKEFMCIGATPPFDHPHVFCDMGDDDEIIKVDTDVVTVLFTAQDRSRRLLTSLKQDDVKILEDGKPQDVTVTLEAVPEE